MRPFSFQRSIATTKTMAYLLFSLTLTALCSSISGISKFFLGSGYGTHKDIASNNATINTTASTTSSPTTISYVSGSVAVESCYLAWASWETASQQWYTSAAGFQTATDTATNVRTIYSTYKLCDGFPRAVLTGNYTFITTTSTDIIEFNPSFYLTLTSTGLIQPSPVIVSVFTTVYTTTITVVNVLNYPSTTAFYSVPPPACEIDPTDCASLYAASSNAMYTGGSYNSTASPTVVCGTALKSSTAPCYITIPSAQLIYWPVTLASQDLCVYPNPLDITATPAANETIPTVTAFGTTFTSDENCYISIFSVTAGWSPLYIQSSLPGGILTVPSSDLRSYRGHDPGQTIGNIYSFNFADLYPNHVPILAYEGTLECNDKNAGNPYEAPFCATIVEDLYAPNLVYPTQVYDLYPQLSSCDFAYEGLFDPPTFLLPADALTPISTPAGTTTSAPPALNDNQVTSPPTTASATWAMTSVVGSPTDTTQSASKSSVSEVSGDLVGGVSSDDSDGNSTPGAAHVATESTDVSLVAVDTTVTLNGGSTVTVSTNDDSGGKGGSNVESNDGGDGAVVVDGISLSQGQVTIIGDQTISALRGASGVAVAQNGQTTIISLAAAPVADPSYAPGIAIFTLGNGITVTATSSTAPNGSPVVLIGSQTLTAGTAFTTAGSVLSLSGDNLILSGASASATGAIFTDDSTTLTAIQTVNSQGATVIDIDGDATATVGKGPVTLSNGEVVSAASNGLVVVGAGSTTTVSYSGIQTPFSEIPPNATTISFLTESSTTAATTSSKKGDSSKKVINMAQLLAVFFLVALWAG